MSASTAAQRARSQLNYLKQTVERFETFHAVNFKREIRDFFDFFTQDDVLGILSRILLQSHQTVSPKAWHDQVQSTGTVAPLPADPADALAFRLATLRLIRNNKLDLRYFVSNHFSGAHLNEKLMHWKRLMVHPLAQDCRTLADDLLARLGDAEWIDFGQAIGDYLAGPFQQAGFGPRAWTDEDDARVEAAEAAAAKAPRAPAPRPAPAPSPSAAEATDLGQALDALAKSVNGLSNPADLLLDVAALRLEISRGRRQFRRIRSRLDAMATVPALAEACLRVRSNLA